MLSGRRGVVRIRAGEPGAVIEVAREHVLALVQTDSELSEILLRAFLLRRVELIAQGVGDVVLVGSRHSASTLRLQAFLTRNSHPYLPSTSTGMLAPRICWIVSRSPLTTCRW